MNVNVKDKEKQRPLQLSARQGGLEMCKELILLGANGKKQDEDGWTALHEAAQEGHHEVCSTLIYLKSKVSNNWIDV